MSKQNFVKVSGGLGMVGGLLGVGGVAYAAWAPEGNNGFLALPALMVIVGMFGIHVLQRDRQGGLSKVALSFVVLAPFLSLPFGWGAGGVLLGIWFLAYILFFVATYRAEAVSRVAIAVQGAAVVAAMAAFVWRDRPGDAYVPLLFFWASWLWLGYWMFSRVDEVEPPLAV